MKMHRIAQGVAAALLVTALGVGIALKTRPAPEPQDAIYAMLAAARAGDVKAYLARYTGPMEAELRETLAQTTESGFAQYLRDSHASLKGVALSDPRKTSDLEVKVRVEFIYQDRNEAQTMYLVKGSSGWKIFRADNDERLTTLIPYGTPAK